MAETAVRAWLAAAFEARPLAAAGEVPVGRIAAGGPALCAAVLHALGADEPLERLTAGPEGTRLAFEAGLGAGEPVPATLATMESLRVGVLRALQRTGWLADPDRALAVADRLAHVCARLGAALAVVEGAAPAAAPDDPPGPATAPVVPGAEVPDAPTSSGRAFHDLVSAIRASSPVATPPVGGWPAPEPTARPLWIAALERQLAHGGRFCLLLVDVDGSGRLRLADPEGIEESGGALAAVGQSIRDQVRRGDLLAHEAEGRTWVIAPEAAGEAGRSLAARLAAAVERSGRTRGVPLTVSVGVAVFPDDGREARALTDHAEERMFAARATGRSVLIPNPG